MAETLAVEFDLALSDPNELQQSPLQETITALQIRFGYAAVRNMSKTQRLHAFAEYHRDEHVWADAPNVTAAAWVLGVQLCIYAQRSNATIGNLARTHAIGPIVVHPLCLWNKGARSSGGTGFHFAAIQPNI
jgi:hypothetical protein